VALEPGGEGRGGDLEGGGELGGGDGIGGEDGLEGCACFCHGGWGKGRSRQKTMLNRAETIDFSLPKPGFTQNPKHSQQFALSGLLSCTIV
jgi:hypothetical protein